MVGLTISHYHVHEKLGGGGMGVVYRAQDLRLGRSVALKFLPQGAIPDLQSLERLRREARTASSLNHPNICTIHDIDDYDGQPFIVMEWMDGETLKHRLQSKPLAPGVLVDLAIQIADALDAAHTQNIVHRDLKPANIFVTRRDQAKVLDFGLAKLIVASRPAIDAAAQTRTADADEHLTKPGSTVGTVAYMSPEQARGEVVDARTDLFSFGIVLYEMATGSLPFSGATSAVIFEGILSRTPAPPAQLNPRIPAELDRIITHALQKDRAIRYQHAADMRADLLALKRQLDSGGIATATPSAPVPRRAFRTWASTAAVLVVIAGAATWLATPTRDDQSQAAPIASIEERARAGALDDVEALLREHGLQLGDSRLEAIRAHVGGTLAVQTDPPGARVAVRRISAVDPAQMGPSLALGETPITAHTIVAGEYLAELSRTGYWPLTVGLRVAAGQRLQIARTLVSAESAVVPMVAVTPGVANLPGGPIEVPAFLIDVYEVTNDDFARFVTAGGYGNRALWPDQLVVSRRMLPRVEALQRFVDRTNLPGPRAWSGGKPPEGRGRHPVTGVSWYEAAAYARWAGKDLPTSAQWWRAAMDMASEGFPWGPSLKTIDRRANFGHLGTTEVGSFPVGVSAFGCYDMPGNVREWLRDSQTGSSRRGVAGGSFADEIYMFEPSHIEWFDPDYSNEGFGFRLVRASAAGSP